MKAETLKTLQKGSNTSEKMLQGKHSVDVGSSQRVRRAVLDRHKREPQCCESTSPQKTARIELDYNNCGDHKKNGRANRKGVSYEPYRDEDVFVLIKSENVDTMEEVQIKEELQTREYVASSSHKSSAYSNPQHFFQSSLVDSVKSPVASSLNSTYSNSDAKKYICKQEHASTSTGGSDDILHQEQPDSSTGSFEHPTRDVGRGINECSTTMPESSLTTTTHKTETTLCQVCGDLAAGFYCGAYICEACKKFFIRASKLDTPTYVCLRSQDCVITKESRVHCQYCRFQKCLHLNMYYPKGGQKNGNKMGVQEIPCRVCSAPSSGFHFGALTCEGCKGFFRRMVKEREAYSYKCSKSGHCEVNAATRNMCKACRYNKCLQIGMSVEGSRIGRQPNAVKYAITLEAKKQIAMKEEIDDNGVTAESNQSSISFDSVILDHCHPGEVDSSLNSVDLTQVSSSVNAFNSPSRKLEEATPDQQHEPFYSRENQVLNMMGQPLSSVAQEHLSDEFTHNTTTSPNHYMFMSNVCPMNPSPASVNLQRFMKPQLYERPHDEMFDSSSDNQPQDLSLNLSIPRTTEMNSDLDSFHFNLSRSSRHHFPPPSIPHPSPISPSGPINLSSSSSNPASSTPLSSGIYIRKANHTLQSPYYNQKFVERDNTHAWPGDQDYVRYEDNTSSYKIDSSNSYPQPPKYRQTPEQEEFIRSTLHSHDNHSHVLEGNIFPVDSIHPYIVQEQHDIHQLVSQPAHQHQSNFSGQRTVEDDKYPQGSDIQIYRQQIERDFYRGDRDLNSLNDRTYQSSQLHNLKMSHQQWPPPQQSVPQKSSYKIPHSSPPNPSLPVPQYQCREPIPLSTLPKTNNIQNPLNSDRVPGNVSVTCNNNCLNLSNEYLHGVVLDAAINLTLFCANHRAKSDIFEAHRFKDVDATWETMMEHFNIHAKCIVRFARKVPGFRSLKIDDQVLLLRMATYSLVILNHSRAYESETGFYNYFNFSHREIHIIRELFPEFDVIHAHYKHVGKMAQRYGLTEMEYAYMSCLLLLNDEHQGLENGETTKELKERYLDAFLHYELEHFSEGNLRFHDILLRLSEFSQFNMQHNTAVGLVITKNPQLHIPQLYAEMYTYNSSVPNDSGSVSTNKMSEVRELVDPPAVDIDK